MGWLSKIPVSGFYSHSATDSEIKINIDTIFEFSWRKERKQIKIYCQEATIKCSSLKDCRKNILRELNHLRVYQIIIEALRGKDSKLQLQ